MPTRRVEIPMPVTVGELKNAVGRILFIQSLVDDDSGRLMVLESRKEIIRKRLEAEFGISAEDIPDDTPVSGKFSRSVIRQWMN